MKNLFLTAMRRILRISLEKGRLVSNIGPIIALVLIDSLDILHFI